MSQHRNIPKGGTRGTRFERVAQARLTDAEVLMKGRRYLGALYLAGYAVECILKFAVTQRKTSVYLPGQLEVHNWDDLLKEAGLVRALQGEPKLRAIYSELADFWKPEIRYESKEPPPEEARRLYERIKQVYDWLREQTI